MVASATSSTKAMFNILVISSHPGVEELMQLLLTPSGLGCRHAINGTQGVAAFHSAPTDLVLLATNLPDRKGLEICVKLRENSTVPIVMVTAQRDRTEELQALKVGADAYLEEPFNSQLVLAHVVAQLRRAYRYDERPVPSTIPEKTPVPKGWATCESCGYMGPEDRFQAVNQQRKVVLMCPNCQQGDYVVFSLA